MCVVPFLRAASRPLQFEKKSQAAGKGGGGMSFFLRTVIPYTAVASAGALNVFLMRRNEAKEGIAVKDKDGRVLGVSQIAGRKAIEQTVLTRVALPAPGACLDLGVCICIAAKRCHVFSRCCSCCCAFAPAPMPLRARAHPRVFSRRPVDVCAVLMLPPITMALLNQLKAVKGASPRAKVALEIAVVTGSLWLALPLSIGLFPQVCTAPASALETKFQGLKDKDGKLIDTVFFNKGL